MEVNLTFRNPFQENLFWERMRNQCGSGGFNNGKTYLMCQKALLLLLTFPNYRVVMARQLFKDLKATTMQTFFKVCPRSLILTHDNQAGITILKNRSLIYWMHLDAFDEQSLRGLEINSVFLDQAEEIEEAIYLVLDSRIGRWDKAEVPQHLLDANPNWPKHPKWGHYLVPNYMVLGCNPDSQFHWIYRWYHPESLEIRKNHIMYEAETDVNLGDAETMEQMLGRDEEWVKKYFRGQWGISQAQIHYVSPQSVLDPAQCVELLARIKKRGNLYRVLDHGEAAPTCCSWFAALDNIHIGYREYYMPNTVISQHRRNITDLSEDEHYAGNYADPDIFKKHSQKEGSFWTVADEYSTKSISGQSLSWSPADNNEFATRNRINECLKLNVGVKHPITGVSPAPRLYFIKKTRDYQNGVFHGITQLQQQRRKLLTSINGKSIYSDDRDDSVVDHAYDTERYYIAIHGANRAVTPRDIPRNSFAWYNRLKSSRQRQEVLQALSDSRVN